MEVFIYTDIKYIIYNYTLRLHSCNDDAYNCIFGVYNYTPSYNYNNYLFML